MILSGKIAVFVDGCFWHGCPWHGTMPKTNARFWRDKILRNKERDEEADLALTRLGWKAVHIWEHEIKKSVDKVAEKLEAVLMRRLLPSRRKS